MIEVTRIQIIVHGAVQGVGFRPFVYRLAAEMGLTGWVSNSPQGVLIEVEGPKHHLDAFLIRVRHQHPPHAVISAITRSDLTAAGSRTFEIRNSNYAGPKRTLILPDIATCPECLGEVFDPSNRRYLYPFTNCNRCGPRFSIIESLPYDRGNTTMRIFSMCEECRSEYENPLSRRFHAPPNACAACGPYVELWKKDGHVCGIPDNAIAFAAEALKSGKIVAVKGLGGFHLMADAANEDAVHRLRKPLAIMVPSVEFARALCEMTADEEQLIASPEAPIVLLRGRNDNLGVMLPHTPLHHILMKNVGRPVVVTSGNRGDEPICIDDHDALHRLGDIADLFLVHNRPIRRHMDDSIVRLLLGRPQILRRARGYAPLPITIKGSLVPAVAAGGRLKNTVAITVPAEDTGQTNVFVSQHIGDLETNEARGAFQATINDLQRLYEVRPEVIARDTHPDAPTSQYSAGQTERVQHQWAHVVSCMTEHDLEAPVLGVAWNESGHGLDGTIWGGEFLVAENDSFRRAGHFRTFPLPGGEAAIRRPKDIALGLLYEVFGEMIFDGSESPLLRQMLIKGIRSPRTSSAELLINGVASIAGMAATEFEFAAAPATEEFYPYVVRPGESLVVDWEPMVRTIVADVREGTDAGKISARFHNTMAEIILDIAERIGESRIVLTGSSFENRYLTERTVRRLTSAGFSTYWHERIPTNDGGLSLGQAVAACKQNAKDGVVIREVVGHHSP